MNEPRLDLAEVRPSVDRKRPSLEVAYVALTVTPPDDEDES